MAQLNLVYKSRRPCSATHADVFRFRLISKTQSRGQVRASDLLVNINKSDQQTCFLELRNVQFDHFGRNSLSEITFIWSPAPTGALMGIMLRCVMVSWPDSAAATQPQAMMLPPLCFSWNAVVSLTLKQYNML